MPFRETDIPTIERLLGDTFFGASGLLDPSTRYLNLDSLWSRRDFFSSTTNLVYSTLVNANKWDGTTAIMAADALKSPFGAIPLAAGLAYAHSLDLIIWKEHGDYMTGRALTFGEGSQPEEERVGIVHDVLAGGFAVLKMIAALASLHRYTHKTYTIASILSLVRLCSTAELSELIRLTREISGTTIQQGQFVSVLDLSSYCIHK